MPSQLHSEPSRYRRFPTAFIEPQSPPRSPPNTTLAPSEPPQQLLVARVQVPDQEHRQHQQGELGAENGISPPGSPRTPEPLRGHPEPPADPSGHPESPPTPWLPMDHPLNPPWLPQLLPSTPNLRSHSLWTTPRPPPQLSLPAQPPNSGHSPYLSQADAYANAHDGDQVSSQPGLDALLAALGDNWVSPGAPHGAPGPPDSPVPHSGEDVLGASRGAAAVGEHPWGPVGAVGSPEAGAGDGPVPVHVLVPGGVIVVVPVLGSFPATAAELGGGQRVSVVAVGWLWGPFGGSHLLLDSVPALVGVSRWSLHRVLPDQLLCVGGRLCSQLGRGIGTALPHDPGVTP